MTTLYLTEDLEDEVASDSSVVLVNGAFNGRNTTAVPALHDCGPDADGFFQDIMAGLRRPQKSLPCKYFYDERGSQLFDAICELDEYYPTRTETGILQSCVSEIGERLGDGCRLVEYGSGSSTKTRILLGGVPGVTTYVPVDISRDHLHTTACRLSCDYPNLTVMPVCADYTRPFSLPPVTQRVASTAVFFPGSTIGNFDPHEAREFLEGIAALVGPGGGLLIGVDLKKDPAVLHAAYNDARGVTAEFNLNVLRNVNNTLDADFDLNGFRHHAFYNQDLGRIEMHLVSERDQTVTIGGEHVRFRTVETIHTECSYKYSLTQFAALASNAGYTVEQVWTDPQELFSVQWLRVD